MKIVATTFEGLEPLLEKELAALGASHLKTSRRAVEYQGDLSVLYRSNYLCRTAIRILVPIFHFRARNERELYQGVQRVSWSKYLDVEDTLAIDAVTSGDFFRHSKYASLKTKDAIVDQFRTATGRRPSVRLREPSLRIHLRIVRDQCTLSLDSSDDSLHRRGYRLETLEAPINEVLAAGLIQKTGWNADRPFIDPMCGSGTILIEAAMLASHTPAQYFRQNFGFQKWKNFDYGIWSGIVKEAKAGIKPVEVAIYGYDLSRKAIEVAAKNIRNAGFAAAIKLEQKDFLQLDPPEDQGIIVTNPPYDERLQNNDILEFYQAIGDRLKQTYAGYQAWLLSSNFSALKKIGLRPSKKMTLFNGALECKFQCFELYTGSKKGKFEERKSGKGIRRREMPEE